MDGDLGENEKKLKVEPKWCDCGVGFGDILTVDFWCSNLFFLSRVMSAISASHIVTAGTCTSQEDDWGHG